MDLHSSVILMTLTIDPAFTNVIIKNDRVDDMNGKKDILVKREKDYFKRKTNYLGPDVKALATNTSHNIKFNESYKSRDSSLSSNTNSRIYTVRSSHSSKSFRSFTFTSRSRPVPQNINSAIKS